MCSDRKKTTGHDQVMPNFFSQFASPGELVFDVGANVGKITKIFLDMGMEVVAIEPQDECVNILDSNYGKNENLTIIQKVLGPSVGEAELHICSANTLSSLSVDWIKSVKSSGRFHYSWEEKKIIPMTTIDQLIDLYGVPAFIKIDVEGSEYEVMKGLSRPINYISFEFVPEFVDQTFKCIKHLESLGEVLFNYSGGSTQFKLEEYVTAKEIKDILNSYKKGNMIFGDVYCKSMLDQR